MEGMPPPVQECGHGEDQGVPKIEHVKRHELVLIELVIREFRRSDCFQKTWHEFEFVHAAEVFQLSLHEQASGGFLDELRDADGRSVGAMGGAKASFT